MRVMCINDQWIAEKYDDTPSPKYSEICEVANELEKFGKKFYILVGYPGSAFAANNFVPLSDIDEVEIYEDRLVLVER